MHLLLLMFHTSLQNKGKKKFTKRKTISSYCPVFEYSCIYPKNFWHQIIHLKPQLNEFCHKLGFSPKPIANNSNLFVQCLDLVCIIQFLNQVQAPLYLSSIKLLFITS